MWELIDITLRSLYVSGTATLLSTVWSIPLGMLIGLRSFPGKRLLKGVFNALLGIPTVVLGLVLFFILSKGGPLGFLDILYTPLAIIFGQAILVTPIMVSLTVNAVESVDPEIKELAKTLGASETEASFAVLRESTAGVLLAGITSFNRAISELGVALMLGGGFRGVTAVLTTTIAVKINSAEPELAIETAIILMTIVFAISLVLNLAQRRSQ